MTKTPSAIVEVGRLARRASGSRDAYMVIRNEADRLPHVLDHHRRLGIERFFVVDNGSIDGGPDHLAAQPDCHLYRTAASFAGAAHGMDWINALLDRHGEGNWCLFIDADELFTYPHAERLTLPGLCAALDRAGDEGMFALVLDMYAEGSVASAHYRPGTPFLDTCRHFDRDYTVRPKVRLNLSKPAFAQFEAVGGPRARRFYPELAGAGPWRIALSRALRGLRLHPLGQAAGLQRLALGSAIPPDLTKIPLIKGARGRRWISNHRTTPLRLSPVTGALLHFKFFSNFHEQAVSEAERGEHWDGGNEYVRYRECLERDPGLTLFHAGSEAYRSTDRLVELGIMSTSRELARFAGNPVQEVRLSDRQARHDWHVPAPASIERTGAKG